MIFIFIFPLYIIPKPFWDFFFFYHKAQGRGHSAFCWHLHVHSRLWHVDWNGLTRAHTERWMELNLPMCVHATPLLPCVGCKLVPTSHLHPFQVSGALTLTSSLIPHAQSLISSVFDDKNQTKQNISKRQQTSLPVPLLFEPMICDLACVCVCWGGGILGW